MRRTAWLLVWALSACSSPPVPPVLVDDGCGHLVPRDALPTSGQYQLRADTDCESCRQECQTCVYSINCQPGSICNDPSEDLYNPAKPLLRCTNILCDSDAACAAPRTCSLEHVCRDPVCQIDRDCPAPQVCLAGACGAAPSPSLAADCFTTTRGGVIGEGATLALSAVARDGRGAAIPKQRFEWRSSAPEVAAVTGTVAIGGAQAGIATLTAKLGKLACTGSVAIERLAALPADTLRVVARAEDDGLPIAGAAVVVYAPGQRLTASTDARGIATLALAVPADSVTVLDGSFGAVTVLAPGTREVLLAIPAARPRIRAAGVRGSVDLSTTKRADIRLGWVGAALPERLIGLDLDLLAGDSFATSIDAPDLGLANQTVDLPGGALLALGSKNFTDHRPTLCDGTSTVAAQRLGCFAARVPEGPGPAAIWTLSGQLKLSAVSQIAGRLSGALSGTGDPHGLPFGDLAAALAPLLQRLDSGLRAAVPLQSSPKVPRAGADCSDPHLDGYEAQCIGDASRYAPLSIRADQTERVLGLVVVPRLPATSSAAILAGAARLPGRGRIPLGLSAWVMKPFAEPPGVNHPFGQYSAVVPDDVVGLALAPRHSGAEDGSLELIALAFDFHGARSLLIGGLERLDAASRLEGDFLTPPAGVLDLANLRWNPRGQPGQRVTATVLELARRGTRWRIYALGDAAITLPDLRDAWSPPLGPGVSGAIERVRSGAPYEKLWSSEEAIEAIATTPCGSDPGAACRLMAP